MAIVDTLIGAGIAVFVGSITAVVTHLGHRIQLTRTRLEAQIDLAIEVMEKAEGALNGVKEMASTWPWGTHTVCWSSGEIGEVPYFHDQDHLEEAFDAARDKISDNLRGLIVKKSELLMPDSVVKKIVSFRDTCKAALEHLPENPNVIAQRGERSLQAVVVAFRKTLGLDKLKSSTRKGLDKIDIETKFLESEMPKKVVE